jgi:hypothetical protein
VTTDVDFIDVAAAARLGDGGFLGLTEQSVEDEQTAVVCTALEEVEEPAAVAARPAAVADLELAGVNKAAAPAPLGSRPRDSIVPQGRMHMLCVPRRCASWGGRSSRGMKSAPHLVPNFKLGGKKSGPAAGHSCPGTQSGSARIFTA